MLWLIIACTDPGRSEHGLLLVDGPALDAGWLVEIDGHAISTALPVHEVDEPVLLDPDGDRVEVEFFPDEVTWIGGPDGEVDWLTPGTDVARDAVELVADEATALDIAEQLDGRVDEVETGIWLLEASEVLLELTWVEEPSGLYETLPLDDPSYVMATSPARDTGFGERLDELERRVESIHAGPGARPAARGLDGMLRQETQDLQDRLTPWLWVGAWEVDGRCVILDAAGGVDDCRGRPLGSWDLDAPQPTLSFQLDSADHTWTLRSAR